MRMLQSNINVLVACEESQRVCKAFLERGFNAFSCDIIEPSGDRPDRHILDDVLPLLNGNCEFSTMDGKRHKINGKWNLIIAHPPCTYLSVAGAARLYVKKGVIDKERYKKGMEAKEFFMAFINADCEHIAVENPVQLRVFGIKRATQYIQPYEYGHPYSKKTGLWLKGLPLLRPTEIITDEIISWVSGGSKTLSGVARKNKGTPFRNPKIKSKTFPGIAKAMAEQWGDFILND